MTKENSTKADAYKESEKGGQDGKILLYYLQFVFVVHFFEENLHGDCFLLS